MSNDYEMGELAFAKIVSKEKQFYMNEHEVTLGRDAKENDLKYLCIDPKNTTISKQHAIIKWESELGGFYIKNLSKNKVNN